MTKFENEMQNIKAGIANMSILVGEMFSDAVKAVKDHDPDLAIAVIQKDKKVDRLDIEIDEMCLKVLALYSPKAVELRYLVAVLRLIIDLERVGDHSKVIAKQVKKQHLAPMISELPEFDEMAAITLKLLNDSMDGFFEKNAEVFAEAVAADKQVGAFQNHLNKALVGIINSNSASTKAAVSLINIIRRMERVADHAKNVAEMVPYVKTGEIMRHRDKYNETDI